MGNKDFDKVLTLCMYCKKIVTVKASYEDRNKEYLCKECMEEMHKCSICGVLRNYCGECV